ncbi:MAG: CotH kinase family protein [Saprospiraceae bacterium]|nr:CotH kinase family protein [Saprospiraceae bacterium]
MKTRTFCSCLILLCNTALFAQKDGENLFEPSVLHEIRFESEHPDLFSLMLGDWQNNPEAPPYRLCDVRIDGQLADSVGARIKGGLSAFNQKRPLKIDFNTFDDNQSYDGLKKLNLLNADFDRAMQRDMLGYVIFRQAGVKSSRSAYAKVYINNVYHGVYVLVEQVDKTFLKGQFADDEGILYKNKICTVEVDEGENTLEYYQELIQIAQQLDGQNFVTALEAVLDTDAFLRFFLVEHFINAADNPIDVDCNYYVYRIPDLNQLYWIPWDLNYAFYSGLNYELFEPGANIVFNRMMGIPVYRERYSQLACEMLQYLFTEEHLHPIIEQHAQLIRDEVAADPRYDYTIEGFDQDVTALKTFVTQRKQAFMEDLADAGVVCTELTPPAPPHSIVINEFVASADSEGGIADPQGGYPDWIELYNTTSDTVSLRQYYLSNHRHNLKHWRFPDDIRIPPQGYLIVWADRDIADEGLHADFKLDKEGGSIYLSFENLTITDSVTYSPQSTNVASARVPNGIGAFLQQTPTFAANNEFSSVKPGLFPEYSILIHPNPATSFLQTTFTVTTENPYNFRLVNPLGQTVLNHRSHLERAEWYVGHLPPGLYKGIIEWGGKSYSSLILLHR